MLDRPSSSEETHDWSDEFWFSPQDSPDSPGATHAGTGTLLQARPVAVGSAYQVTTEDVLEVLGDDAHDLLASSQLEMGELVQMLNAETMLLPRIDADLEREIEAALAGATEDEEPEAKPAKTLTGTKSPWRKRFLRAAIGAVLLTAAGGGVAAAAMTKTVNLEVDGHTETVHTFANSVGGVLDAEDLNAGPHDTLSPSPAAAVADGGTVTLDRGRELNLTVDGVRQQHWVHSGSLATALRSLNIDTTNAWLSQSPDAQVPLAGESVELKTLKNITLIDGANKPRTVQSHAVTVGELLRSLNVNLGKGDTVSPSADMRLGNGSQVMVSRTGIQVVNTPEDIAPPVQQVQDDSMFQGDSKVIDPGVVGKKMVTYRITSVNGKESKREQLAVKILTQAKAKIVHIGTKERPMDNEALWDEIAGCESTNNWSANTGNGYYGGLQFDRGTWLSNGGGQYAPTADKATKAEQIEIANRVKADRGLSPWQCAGELGLD